MALTTIGDASQFFVSRRNNTALRTRLNTLTRELSSGQAADLSLHLGPDRARLAAIDRSLALIDSYAQATTETAQTLSLMQTSLGFMEDTRANMAKALVPITNTATYVQTDEGARSGENGFRSIVQSLNGRIGDRALFAGTATGGAAVAPANDMLAALRTVTAGMTTASDVTAAVDAWFDDPAGGYATMGYLGDSGTPLTRQVGPDRSVEIDATAMDPGIRDLLKAAAMAALAGDGGPPLAQGGKVALLREAGDRMMTVAYPLTQIGARLGTAEETVATVTANQAAQKTLFTQSRNDLSLADPFETAAALQQVQVQLETHYTVTARLSHLTLSEYLR